MEEESRRSFKLYRVEVRGLPNNAQWMTAVFEYFKGEPIHSPVAYASKYHILHEAKIQHQRLRLVFASYSLGDRPDVIDTSSMKIKPSPLDEDQANVSYTHAMAWKGKESSLLLLEINNAGIGKAALSVFLGNLLTVGEETKTDTEKQERARVFIDPVSGDEDFFARVKHFDRIISFSLKFLRQSNPGIPRAINDLASKMDESRAGSVEITARPEFGESIPTDVGIIPHGETLREQEEVDQLKATGYRNNQEDTLNSNKMEEKYRIDALVGRGGKIRSDDVFGKLAAIVEEIVF
jgi:hypothetical protein